MDSKNQSVDSKSEHVESLVREGELGDSTVELSTRNIRRQPCGIWAVVLTEAVGCASAAIVRGVGRVRGDGVAYKSTCQCDQTICRTGSMTSLAAQTRS